MSNKSKRTYNLSAETVALAKRLVEEHAAPSQDALVEQAIVEFAHRLQDAKEAKQWAQAASDPDFQAESADIDWLYAREDTDAWR